MEWSRALKAPESEDGRYGMSGASFASCKYMAKISCDFQIRIVNNLIRIHFLMTEKAVNRQVNSNAVSYKGLYANICGGHVTPAFKYINGDRVYVSIRKIP